MLQFAAPGPYKIAAILLLVSFFYGITPWRVAQMALFEAPRFVFGSLASPRPPPNTLKAAILNVTSDFSELSTLLQEFLLSSSVDPSVETAFRAFLAQRAQRSHPGLESALDWLLAIYKFAFPFVVISLFTKVGATSNCDTSESEAFRQANGRHNWSAGNGNGNEALPATLPRRGAAEVGARQLAYAPSRVNTSRRKNDMLRGVSSSHAGGSSPLGPETPVGASQ